MTIPSRRVARFLPVLLVLLAACGGTSRSVASAATEEPPHRDDPAPDPSRDARLTEGDRLLALGEASEAEALFIAVSEDEGAPSDDRGYALWMVGEINFSGGDLARAEEAYAYLLAGLAADSAMRGVVQYKLAWTSFRRDQYPDALERFTRVLDAAIAGVEPDLREEAITYLAIIVAEDDWDQDGAPDAQVGSDRAVVSAWRAHHAEASWIGDFDEMLAQTYDELGLQERAAEVRSGR